MIYIRGLLQKLCKCFRGKKNIDAIDIMKEIEEIAEEKHKNAFCPECKLDLVYEEEGKIWVCSKCKARFEVTFQ